jgi:uncharacterized protein YjbI with pentapeptide repeats
MNNPTSRASRRVRFEEVTPAHEYAAFFSVSIAPLVAHLGIPVFDGYDDLDDLQLAFLTLLSGETVTLGEYAGMPGTSLYIEVKMQSIPQIIFDSCQQLRVSRQELEWVHPDYQVEFDRLSAEHGEMEGIDRASTEVLAQSEDSEPIDCFYHALEIYTRPKFPEHWAMLQHNLGLAYFDRIKGERWRNLRNSIKCFNKSLEVFDSDKYPRKWQINQEDLSQSQEALKVERQNLVQDILSRSIKGRYLFEANLSGASLSGVSLREAYLSDTNLSFVNLSFTNLSFTHLINSNLNGANLHEAYLSDANLSGANLSDANLSDATLYDANLSETYLSGADLSNATLYGSNLSDANLSNANLHGANLRNVNLINANLSGAKVDKAQFGYNLGISELMRKDLEARGARFDDALGDRSESRTLVPR